MAYDSSHLHEVRYLVAINSRDLDLIAYGKWQHEWTRYNMSMSIYLHIHCVLF